MDSGNNQVYPRRKSTKKYCDTNFKIQLSKALKANCGEADNLEKIRK